MTSDFASEVKFDNCLLNLLCLHTVNDRVEHRRDEQEDIGHDGVDKGGCRMAIAVYKRQADERDVEDGNGTDVGDARIEGFLSLI